MDLRELRYFRAVAELGSFAKAATHLNVAQPALSRQVRKLEFDLGVELFVRMARGVQLTAAGHVLLDHTIQLDAHIDAARREVAVHATQVVGALRIGASFPVAQRTLPRLVAEYRGVHPAVQIELFESASGPMIDGLMAKDLDVCLIEPPSHPHPDLTCIPLWVEDVSFIMSKGEGQDITSPMTLDEVACRPLIMPNRNHTFRRMIDNALARAHLSYEPEMEVNGASLIIELVKQGMGCTLLPISAIDPDQLREFCIFEVQPRILRSIGIVARTDAIHERSVSSFIEMTQRLVPEIAKGSSQIAGTYHLGDAAPLMKISPSNCQRQAA